MYDHPGWGLQCHKHWGLARPIFGEVGPRWGQCACNVGRPSSGPFWDRLVMRRILQIARKRTTRQERPLYCESNVLKHLLLGDSFLSDNEFPGIWEKYAPKPFLYPTPETQNPVVYWGSVTEILRGKPFGF